MATRWQHLTVIATAAFDKQRFCLTNQESVAHAFEMPQHIQLELQKDAASVRFLLAIYLSRFSRVYAALKKTFDVF